MKSFRTAILFFSYSVSREAQRKRWCGDDRRRNHRLARELIGHSLSVLERSELPVFHFHEGRQRGESFGERLDNAIREVFDRGYEAVITVGNDNPDIHRIQWHEVIHFLKQGRPVLGPDQRGGIYLLGLTRALWENGLLENITWNTGSVFDSLRATGTPHILKACADLNSVRDVSLLLKKKEAGRWLWQIMRVNHMTSYRIRYRPVVYPNHQIGLRAPPVKEITQV